MPTQDASIAATANNTAPGTGARLLATDTVDPKGFGRAVDIQCTVAGNVRLFFLDGTTLDLFMAQTGAYYRFYSINKYSTTAPGSPATCSVYNIG